MIPKIEGVLPAYPNEWEKEQIEGIPGVKVRGRLLSASYHAWEEATRLLAAWNVTLANVRKVGDWPEPVTWEDVKTRLLERGEVHHWALVDDPPPGEFGAFTWQREGVTAAAPRLGFLLHHPTGSGKSFSAILWALFGDGPVIWVVPAKARLQMVAQVGRYTTLKAFACKPKHHIRKRDRWATLDEYMAWCNETRQRPVIIVGQESLTTWADKLPGGASLIIDESQGLRSHKRWDVEDLPPKEIGGAPNPAYTDAVKQVKARKGFVKPAKGAAGDRGQMVGIMPTDNRVGAARRLAVRSLRRLLITATPIKDRVRDWFGQLDLMEPGAHGAWSLWSAYFAAARPGSFGGMDTRGESHREELQARLAYLKHRVPAAAVTKELPPKRRESIYVTLDEQCEPTDGFDEEAAKAKTRYDKAEVARARAASVKREAVFWRVGDHLDSMHKVVLFTGRRRDCTILAKSARKRFKGVKVFCGHGGVSANKREKMRLDYGAHPGPCMMVGTWQAWGLAVDGFQCTDAAFLLMLPITPGDVDQTEGRFCRLGQDRPVIIYYPVAENTIDEHIADMVLDKLPAFDATGSTGTLDGVAKAIGATDDEEALLASILAKIGVQAPPAEDNDQKCSAEVDT